MPQDIPNGLTETTAIPKPRSFGFKFHSNKDLGTWLPEGEDCGLKTFFSNIIGGETAKLGAYGFMASLGYEVNGKIVYGCGGSLINKHYVITAAHCVPPHVPELSEIVLGEHDVTTDPDCDFSGCVAKKVTKKPKEIIVHPGYNDRRPTSLFDIALIRLDDKVELFEGNSQVSTITPVCLPWREDEFVYGLTPDERLMALGWGKTVDGLTSARLKQIELPLFDGPKCKETFTQMNTTLQICAGGEVGVGTCNGDAGGPLVVRRRADEPWFQVGINSYGTPQCGIGYPSVWTSVSALLPWIYDQMEE